MDIPEGRMDYETSKKIKIKHFGDKGKSGKDFALAATVDLGNGVHEVNGSTKKTLLK